MELYLLRHGIAEEVSSTGKDSDRELTEPGRRKLRRVLERAADAGVKPELLLTSPYARARQTAEFAKEILRCEGELVFTEALLPEADPQDVWLEIRTQHGGVNSVMLASHEPLMSRCTGYLLRSSELLVDFKKGGIVRIDVDELGVQPRGLLKWMLIPKLAGA
jgi:phosphohistidine phosphatase